MKYINLPNSEKKHYLCVNLTETGGLHKDEQALLLTSVKTPAIPAWHEPCSSPYFCL